jgi:hypothetical protein
MKQSEIIVRIPLDSLVPMQGTEVTAFITITAPLFGTPPLVDDRMNRLRQEFEKIMPHLARQSRAILEFMLTTPEGWTTHRDLIDDIWARKPEPEPGAVRKAISTLNTALKDLNFGYVVQSRKGMYRLIPMSR